MAIQMRLGYQKLARCILDKCANSKYVSFARSNLAIGLFCWDFVQYGFVGHSFWARLLCLDCAGDCLLGLRTRSVLLKLLDLFAWTAN